MNIKQANIALLIVRCAVAGNLLIHGMYRLLTGGVVHFEKYLTDLGMPPYLAWSITIFEILASISIIVGKWIAPLAIFFCVELTVGIILIHYPSGWFVVGAGANGMEYSVLLIMGFISIAIANWKKP